MPESLCRVFKFKKGDRAIVTGDTASWGHGLDEGDVVTIRGTWKPEDEMYRTRLWGYAVTGDFGRRDIAEMDLIPESKPPTEEELAEVRDSLLQTIKEVS